jgi:hypothetical protein
VTVWGENFHENSERDRDMMARLYPEGMHGAIAAGLTELLGDHVEVRTATQDQPEHGLSAEGPRGTFSARLDASDDAAKLGVADIVLFAVKLYSAAEAARSAAPLFGAQTLGISLLNVQFVRDIAASRASLVQGLRPDNPAVIFARPDLDFGSSEALARLSGEVARQASMVGNVATYHFVFVLTLAVMPLVLLLRVRRGTVAAPPLALGE